MAFFNQYPYINQNDLNLDWIISHLKDLIDELASLEDWRRTHEAQYAELKALYDAIVSGNFPDSMKTALYNWVVVNTPAIIGAAIKYVFFDLTPDGYLRVTIPDTWELVFGTTGLDTFPLGVGFGHLTIDY